MLEENLSVVRTRGQLAYSDSRLIKASGTDDYQIRSMPILVETKSGRVVVWSSCAKNESHVGAG